MSYAVPHPKRGSRQMPLYPFDVHNQAKNPGKKELGMSGNLEIRLQGLRGQSSLEMGEKQ